MFRVSGDPDIVRTVGRLGRREGSGKGDTGDATRTDTVYDEHTAVSENSGMEGGGCIVATRCV